jgi:hypothetical protein
MPAKKDSARSRLDAELLEMAALYCGRIISHEATDKIIKRVLDSKMSSAARALRPCCKNRSYTIMYTNLHHATPFCRKWYGETPSFNKRLTPARGH